ncbi:MAG TPA: hypothetical protein VFX49_05510 [Chloroflexota bacterium]|nr:hypothetical protein [Chloroflexota bacterium]
MLREVTRTQRAYVPREGVEVAVYEGLFEELCELCFVSPTVIAVEIREPDMGALQKRGEGVPRDAVIRRYFCAEHVTAADMVFRSYV